MAHQISNLEYLRFAVEQSMGKSRTLPKERGDAYLELAKLELMEKGESTEPIIIANLDAALKWIDDRNDCADFIIPAFIRIMNRHRGTGRLDKAYAQKIEESLVGFKYWLDEPEETSACFFTENHQILYHSAEYLAGQLFPQRVFPSNGQTGEWHRQHSIPFIRRWLDWRARFGFSEWLASGYYAEDILALIGLTEYAAEHDIKVKSKLIIDQLLFDMAVNAFRGHLCTTHGRTYTNTLVEPNNETVTPVMALMWGEGYMGNGISNCATLMAVYDYKCPEAIKKVALDRPAVMINKERMSINMNDAKYYGVEPTDFDNIMLFWGIQVYSDRLVVENSAKVFPYWNWMNNRIMAYKEMYELCDAAGVPAVDAPDYTSLTQADIYTYKTPDYVLSCVQDFRKGRMGYQQHPWTAALGGRAVVFTNSPGSDDYRARPSQLAGNLCLPRAVAHNNVVLCIYRVMPDFVDYLYTHAYFPQHEFDEFREQGGWIFGRKDDAYIAVRSLKPARWKPINPELYKVAYRNAQQAEEMTARAKPYDYMAPGHANVWAVELGSKAQNGGFENFVAGFAGAVISGDTFGFTYNSPSQGVMSFGWNKPLTVEGQEIIISDYKRYENPYCTSEFNSEDLEINCGGKRTYLDYKNLVFIDE